MSDGRVPPRVPLGHSSRSHARACLVAVGELEHFAYEYATKQQRVYLCTALQKYVHSSSKKHYEYQETLVTLV